MTTQVSFMQTKTLNLLLKQQITKQIQETGDEEDNNQVIKFHNHIKEQDAVNKTKTSLDFNINDSLGPEYDDIKIELGNIQVEESALSEQQKILCENYDLLENLLDHILQHIDCVILEIKSSNRLALMLNRFTTQEAQINDNISKSLCKLCEQPNLELLDAIKNRVFVSLNEFGHIQEIRQEFEKRKIDYMLALKNFKIILEVMTINEKSAKKLKQQFDDVLLNYRRCYYLLQQEIPLVLSERMKILTECLNTLGKGDVFVNYRTELVNIMAKLGSDLKGQYMILKKDILK